MQQDPSKACGLSNQKTLLLCPNIWTCHCSENTSGSNNINGGRLPFSLPVSQHARYQQPETALPRWNALIIHIINYICDFTRYDMPKCLLYKKVYTVSQISYNILTVYSMHYIVIPIVSIISTGIFHSMYKKTTLYFTILYLQEMTRELYCHMSLLLGNIRCSWICFSTHTVGHYISSALTSVLVA